MALDPRYITAPSLQEYFVDKDSGFPLAGGKVFFYSDVNRTQPKDVFELTGSPPNYSFSPLPNPVILSSVGTMMDNNGNDIIPYYFPFDAEGNQELYYIVVQSATGVPQFTREAWPNPNNGGVIPPGTQNDLFNYIPNGQFLLHTDLPNNELVAGSNIIAQGGWTFELPESLHSENTLEFIPINFTENPSNSPRFFAQFTCGAAGLDTIKSIRIKWNDVNKFSATQDFFTFAFWARTDIDVPIAIDIIKFCGTDGTVVPPEEIFTDVITPAGQMYVYSFQFPSNSGLVIDTVNNDDYIALDISLPVGISFVLTLTDAAMVDGDVNLQVFPLQTNADMITRGNDGWTNLPKYNGDDLFLPKIQTRIGYQYDEEEVGDIGTTFRPIISPLSTSPFPKSNRMAFDGASYIYADYSTIGIPFSRLGDVLISISPVANTPLFGTGADFATAYVNDGADTIFRLTVNSGGTGVNYANEGGIPTGFTFTGIPTYDGSTVGHASINYFSFSSGRAVNEIICKANFALPVGQPYDYADVSGAPGFTETTINYQDGLYAYQTVAFSIQTSDATTLIQGSLNAASFFYFYTAADHTAPFYVWFNITGEVDPGPPVPGALPIEVILNPTDTAQDVANVLVEIFKAFQSTYIDVDATPPPGSYFTFQTDPGSVKNFHVWYSDQTGGSEPSIPGSVGINVLINNGDSHAVILTKTLIAINKYQYAIPDAPGMYLRNSDPNGVWDFDNLTRWSTVTGLVGPNMGTFEYGQFQEHAHFFFDFDDSSTQINRPTDSSDYYATQHGNYGNSKDYIIAGGNASPDSGPTSGSGGNETRTVNMYVNYYIKY